jgi:Tol biopolymer transport system component
MLSACGDVTQPPGTGSAQVTVTTTGRVLDRDGYRLSVDGAAAITVSVNQTLTVPGLAPGAHTLTFDGVAENCRVTGSASHVVQVVAGQAAPVQLAVQCAANRMAYTAPSNGRTTLFIQRTDGPSRTELATGIIASRLDWSPDGYHVAYLVRGQEGGTSLIRIAEIGDGSVRTLAIPGIPDASFPAWSPDGSRIAFTGRPPGSTGQIYTARTDGSDPTPLTSDAGRKAVPVWSPDGRRIAYLRENGRDEELWVMNADGSGPVRLSTHRHGGYGHLDWSPGGARLVYSKLENDGQWDLWTINADGSGNAPLTRTATVSEEHGTYLPDGRIGYSASPAPPGVLLPRPSDIWIINADGTGATPFISTPDIPERVPDWQ